MSDIDTGFAATPPSPEVVIFDLGGVLIDWNPRYLFRHLFADEASMEHFLSHVCDMPWNEAQDAGRPFADGVALLQRVHPQHAEAIAAYDSRWDEMLGGPIEATVAILRQLKDRGVPLFALTNWSQEKFPIARARFDFLTWFQGIVVSGEEGCKKPDPALYRILLRRHDLNPQQCVFIDDSPHNVEAARALGMHAVRFTSADALAAALRRWGLIAG